MKKIWLNLMIFFRSLAWGMKGADKIIAVSNKDTEGGESAGIEQEKHQQNVYADLLRGEVTQEVKELRYEMYETERKSKEYEYGGNGRAVKKNMFEDEDLFSGVENSDGDKIVLIQENKEDMGTLMDNEIFAYGENVTLGEKAKYNLGTKDKIEYTIKIKRDFFPSFKIEAYTNKIVVKEAGEGKAVLDFYISIYRKQFDNNSKLFLAKIKQIEEGSTNSDILDLPSVEFTTFNAVGCHDLKHFAFNEVKFVSILEYNGDYVVRFTAAVIENGMDLTDEFYDESAAKKIENKEMRHNATLDIAGVIESATDAEYDVEAAKELAKELTDGK